MDKEKDYAVLEDASGRIQITNGEVFDSSQFVTGSIMALLGHADANGFFVVKDFCFAGVPYKPELPRHIKLNNSHESTLFKSELLASPENRTFIAFISGLHFGGAGDLKEVANALW